MPGDDQFPHVFAALSAVLAGDGQTADLQMDVGGPEAVRDLLSFTAALVTRVCQLTGSGDPATLLEEMWRQVLSDS